MSDFAEFSPLAAVQEHFWAADDSTLRTSELTESVAVRVFGPLDPAALTVAINALGHRHEILRSRVVRHQGEPCLVVDPPGPSALVWIEEPQDEGTLCETVRAFVEQGIDPASGPVLKWLVVRSCAEGHVLVCSVHHMFADATAVRVLMEEVAADYAAALAGHPSPVPDPELQYADYVAWEREELLPSAERHEAPWWDERLRGVPQQLDLRLDRPRPPIKGMAGRRDRFQFRRETSEAFVRFCRESNLTQYSVSLAVFAALVNRSTGAREVLVGVLSAGRPVLQLERMVGQFANTLPLPLSTAGDPDLAELARRCGSVVSEALDHSALPLSRIVRLARDAHDPSRTALVQHLFLPVLHPMQGWTIGENATEEYEVRRTRGRFDTVIEVEATGSFVEYDTALYTPDGIVALMTDYEAILSTWVNQPTTHLSQLPLKAPATMSSPPDIPVRDQLTTVVDGPVALADLEAYRGEGKRVLRTVPLAGGENIILDITSAPSAYPIIVSASPGALGFSGSDAGTSPFAPTPLEVCTAEGRSLLARMSPRGGLELVAGVEVVEGGAGGDEGVQTSRERDHLLSLVRALWEDVLDTASVEPDDDFFESGGHSMAAARLVAELSEVLATPVKVRTLFEHSTPRMLATRLRKERPDLDQLLALVEHEQVAEARISLEATPESEQTLPMLASQRQIWLAQLADPGALTHTIPLLLRISGKLDPDALTTAVADVVRRQPGLRATFREEKGVPVQRIIPCGDFTVPVTDLRALPAEMRAKECARLERETAYGDFDMSEGPLLRARLIRVSDHDHVLHLLFHHLVTDEVSMTLFASELSSFYTARVEGKEPTLPPLRLTFSDVVQHEHAMLAGVEGERLRRFWGRELSGAPQLHLTPERSRAGARPFVGEFLQHGINKDLHLALYELARFTRVTNFTVFCSAVIILLNSLSGQDDVIIGVPTENRVRPGSEQLIGCFLNVVPVRVNLSGNPSFEELVGRVRESLLRSYDHQQLPFAEILEAIRPDRVPGMHPIYQVTCELQLPGWLPLDLPGCTTSYELLSHGTARYDMSFHAQMYAEGATVMVELNTELWSKQTGLEMISSVERLLIQLAESPNARLSELRKLAH